MATRILVVDDHGSTRRALRDLLVDEGYSVDTAADGIEALEIVERWRPDVILSDLRMPRMSGEALVEHLRRGHPEIPVIVITARPDAERRGDGLAEIITKPVEFSDLLDRVNAAAPPRLRRSTEPVHRLRDH